MEDFFAIKWTTFTDALIKAPFMYALVVIYIRLIGKRSISQMSSFDWIVTVAMGSIASSTIIFDEVSLLEGSLSILVLLLLQYLITWLITRYSWAKIVVRTTPQLLLFEGKFLMDNMQKERVLKGEVYAAVRSSGYKSTKSIYAVVLETNATLSVIPNDDVDSLGFSLADVSGLPEGLKQDLKERGEEE